MRIIDCEQGTAEWLAARRGVATASRASDALAVLRSGAPAKAALDYAQELAFERVAQCVVDKAVTTAMQRGKELEPFARAAYEARTGELADELGFRHREGIRLRMSCPIYVVLRHNPETGIGDGYG